MAAAMCTALLLLYQYMACHQREAAFWRLAKDEVSGGDEPSAIVLLRNGSRVQQRRRYLRTHPLIFVGGVPRSGTTLVRALLDAHPAVRCGVETRVIPRMLALYERWRVGGAETARLMEAGLLGEPLDAAVTAFLLQVQ